MKNSRTQSSSLTARKMCVASLTMLLVVGAGSDNSVSAAAPGGIQQTETIVRLIDPVAPSSKFATADEPSTPNPYLSWLEGNVEPDYPYWREKIHEQALEKRFARLAAEAQRFGAAKAVIPIMESEPVGTRGMNDSAATAEHIAGFGTGVGDDDSADVTGNLKAPAAPVGFGPPVEDDGNINVATMTGLISDMAVIASATIGDGAYGLATLTFDALVENAEDNGTISLSLDLDSDPLEEVTVDGEIGNGPHGSAMSGSGDFDFYELSITDTQVVTISIAEQAGGMGFNPDFAIFRADGSFWIPIESGVVLILTVTGENCPCTASWYIAVGGDQGAGPPVEGDFPSDSADSSSGPGAGDEGMYTLTVTKEAPPGDWDVYSVTALAGQFVEVEVDTDAYGSWQAMEPILDPVVAVYTSAGVPFVINDNDASANPATDNVLDSSVTFLTPFDDTYFIFVGGSQFFPFSFAHFPSDPFDSSSGPGAASEGAYDVTVSLDNIDLDLFSFDLEAGDIIGINSIGADPVVALFADDGSILATTPADVAGLLPGSGSLPGGGDASLAYVINESGRYAGGVGFGDGDYTLELRALRPPQEATGTRQILFVDFDGANVDPATWGEPPGAVDLSPLADFLADWGLLPSDEDAVIDAILAVMEQNLSSDVKFAGNNPTFDIEILNSRDDPDVFGDPDVSRVIIGGTQAQLGIATIGIAQSVDPGNFDLSEDSVVLLDRLSAPAGPSISLNSYAIDPGSSKIDFIGVGVGNIAAHEAGHFFANFHTDRDNSSPNIMDTGGSLVNTLGIGNDLTFGSGDDIDVNFGVDDFDPGELFGGVEDTRNNIAFGLTTGLALPFTDILGLPDINSNGFADVAVIVQAGSSHVHIRDGSTDDLITDINFGDDPVSGMAVIDDISGNGFPEIALLGTRPSGSVRVQVKDSLTGVAINHIFYGAAFSAVGLAVLPDTDSNGAAELAVLGADAGGSIRVQARDALSDMATSTTFYGNQGPPLDVLTLPDISSNGEPEVLMNSRVTASNQVRTQIRDSATKVLIRNLFFGSAYAPIELVVIGDVSGDGIPDLAQLGRRDDTGATRIQVKRTDTGATISNAFTGSVDLPISVVGIGDANGNTFPDVALLVQRPNGTAKVIVRDGSTGAHIMNIFAGQVSNPVAMALVDDLDASGNPELLILGDDGAGTRRVQIKDSISGATLNIIDFP